MMERMIDDDDKAAALPPEALFELLAADAVTAEVERLRPDFAGWNDLFRAHASPENLAILEAFDAACDRFRQQFYALSDVKHILHTIENPSS
jgi:hypothetical protein